MGITDKVTGRIKKAAGDIAGDEGLHKEGQAEERKSDAKQELAQEDAHAARAQERADRQERQADAKAAEVDRLEKATD
jgi:uncharacterized protein YjbJ (UPF0337 family)